MKKMGRERKQPKRAKNEDAQSSAYKREEERPQSGRHGVSLSKIVNQKGGAVSEKKQGSEAKSETSASSKSRIFTKSRDEGAKPIRKEPSWDIDSVSRALKVSEQEQLEVSEEIYKEGLNLAADVVDKAKNDKLIELKPILEWFDKLINELQMGNDYLLSRAFHTESHVKGEDHIHRSMVNVAILSIRVGIGKKYNRSKLLDVGLVGFFHDIGLVKVLDVVKKEDLLTDEDRSKINEHPRYSMEILEKIEDLSGAVIQGVYQSHERLDGSGYPAGLDNVEKISELARIVAIVDVFEALTHHRPYRKAMMPHDAIKYILETLGAKKFEEAVLKILIDQVGLYPVGSWVVLSNKEIGKVIGLNIGQPIRPKIRIFFQEDGNPVDSSEPMIIDLAQNPLLSIARPLKDEEQEKLSLE